MPLRRILRLQSFVAQGQVGHSIDGGIKGCHSGALHNAGDCFNTEAFKPLLPSRLGPLRGGLHGCFLREPGTDTDRTPGQRVDAKLKHKAGHLPDDPAGHAAPRLPLLALFVGKVGLGLDQFAVGYLLPLVDPVEGLLDFKQLGHRGYVADERQVFGGDIGN